LNFSVEQTQQGVAHEMFHCYQYKNLSEQEKNPNRTASDWWVEGSADYFSNVVYPAVNFEQRDMDELVRHIHLDKLFTWSYKSYIFFQYLENRPDFGGNAGILNLLRSMPSAAGTGINEQAAALAGYDNMGVIFQEFAQAIADQNIIDSDHNPILVPVEMTADDIVEVSPGNILGPDPFSIDIQRIVFPRNFDYNLTIATRNEPGQASARLESVPRDWAPLPPQVHAGCGDERYLFVVTNTNPDLNSETAHYFEYDLRAASVPPTGSCSCLTGKWLLDDSTYFTHLNAIIDQAAPGTVDYKSVNGSDMVTFTQDGHVNQSLEQLNIIADMHVQGFPVQVLTVSMDGTTSASFAAEEGVLHFTDYEANLVIATSLNGQPLSAPNSDFAGGPIGTGASFVCSENTLTLTPKYPNYTGLPPLTFTRQP
jgi:hypothetical protein